MENRLTIKRNLVLAGILSACVTASAQTKLSQIDIQVNHPGPKISPNFFGLMTEEINHAYDGGLYAELIQNRGLRDSNRGPEHWYPMVTGEAKGHIAIVNDRNDSGPSLLLQIDSADANNPVGLANDGYWGVPFLPNTTYTASFYAKASSDFKGDLNVGIQSANGSTMYVSHTVSGLTGTWKKFTVTLKTGAGAPTSDNRFVIIATHPGKLQFRGVSLFPPTYKNRANGNRVDLMEKLAEMKPSFLRLPGGNYLEGNTIAERFNWKATRGEPALREGHQGPWGYRSSDGLGILEFLEWCEDLKMEPVLAVFAGYALNGSHVEPGKPLEPYVQDALDEIEYATGDIHTKWGSERAKDGHPKPFPLKYVEIGNEDWFDRAGTYEARFAQFYDAIKAKYPKLQLISTAWVKQRKPDVVDDHYYRSAAEMARDYGHYDNYNRKGPKIFVGEWASIEGNPTPTHQAALGDAAWLIGMERNSDLVVMEAYAPLLVNVNPRGAQWPTNLIGYDNRRSFGSPSFYVQSLFAKNTGNVVLPTKVNLVRNTAPKPFIPHGGIGVGTWRTDSEYKDIEVTHDGQTLYSKDFSDGTTGWTLKRGKWTLDGNSLRQTTMGDDTHASAGDTNWTDYTYNLKARKMGGEEGFLVLFHVQSGRDYWQWNIGGWGNSRSAIQRHESGDTDEIGRSTNTTIETGRWYDIRIETHGKHVKCYLDDKLITEVDESTRPPVNPIYAGASAGPKGDVYVKVVNFSDAPLLAETNLNGVKAKSFTGEAWQIAGKLEDINSADQPKKIAPHKVPVGKVQPKFSFTYPPYSVTVFHLKPSR